MSNETRAFISFHKQMLENIKKATGMEWDQSCSFDSSKPEAIAKMYCAFCETQNRQESIIEMQERIAWLERKAGL